MSFIHFVGPAGIGGELRPLCGAWSEDISWTTVRAAASCPACARLMRIRNPERRSPARVQAPLDAAASKTAVP